MYVSMIKYPLLKNNNQLFYNIKNGNIYFFPLTLTQFTILCRPVSIKVYRI
jgi:hypothetical protein